jgi:hypothetical protein
METHFTDYPSLYAETIRKEYIMKECQDIINKFADDNIRKRLGGNEGIHNVGTFGNDPSLRSV